MIIYWFCILPDFPSPADFLDFFGGDAATSCLLLWKISDLALVFGDPLFNFSLADCFVVVLLSFRFDVWLSLLPPFFRVIVEDATVDSFDIFDCFCVPDVVVDLVLFVDLVPFFFLPFFPFFACFWSWHVTTMYAIHSIVDNKEKKKHKPAPIK